jgi:CxxC motif-containing protein (DUF1111 family)
MTGPSRLAGLRAVTLALATATAASTGCAVEDTPAVDRSQHEVRGTRLGDPLPGLSAELIDVFFAGEDLFVRDITIAEGLGPLYIEASCVACHALGGIGGGDRLHDENHFVNRLPPAEVLQTRSITALGSACDVAPEEVAADTVIARRNPLQVFGDGLIDHVALDTIDDYVRAVPERGVRGKLGTGRFGWKAQSPTLTGFTAAAANGTMSITTGTAAEQTRFGVAPAAIDPDCSNAALGATTPNDDGRFLRTVVAWEALLAPPARRGDGEAAARGEQIFDELACTLCHRPTMTTRDQDYLLPMPDGTTRPVPQLRNQTIALYSDLLLHDMGPGLAEAISQANAAPSELRTPPLWGVGDRTRFLHDGRAHSLDDAIRAHGGEASEVVAGYEQLDDEDRAHLLAFLRSL